MASPKQGAQKRNSMITRLTAKHNGIPFDWIDITDPTEEELNTVATEYGLHSASVADCMQSGHLPKYEAFKDHTFIILRVCFTQPAVKADTVQELTSKIAVFISDSFIITIHRLPWEPLAHISQDYVLAGRCTNPHHVLNIIVKQGLTTFDETGLLLAQSLDYFEKQVFLTSRKTPLLKGLYFLKRKLDVIRRLLVLSSDVIDRIDPQGASNAYTRDVRDLYIKQKSLYDAMYENTNHLLNIYFNISAQRTNETIRVLTIFSVFFMPLTFIVGVYGMNFQHMPELRWQYGYPFAISMMVIVVLIIYIWFRRKKWL